MRKWASRPLTDPRCISERQDAVQEILESDSLTLNAVKSLLAHLPDLERGVCSIYHKKSSTQEFYLIVGGLSRLGAELRALLPAVRSQIGSALLLRLLLDTPDLLAPAHSHLQVLDERAANQFGDHYHTMKRAISHLATMDCLFSLAEVAKQGDYCRPEVCEGRRQIMIRDGRHPAIDLLMGEHSQYVPNLTELQGDGRRTMIITGPNMGGKSSYIRQVALICVLAQMGSYVPASEARLGVLDGIYTSGPLGPPLHRGDPEENRSAS
ncbi:DNA mismatch repair protein Msh3 [Liparis tanakae]|uniref:DNA mismatch repair protein Msh3 n=1 Tax=Liparis tanakae TaxID=230148 RepID=A0A4Z2EWD8_9TELE|nr:DNA mismatch repair protein Msh3 [Liparis tanakae]